MKAPSYFGRSWKLKVTPQATGEEWTVSNSTWDTEALRLTFEIQQVVLGEYWYADIAVYNLAPGAHLQIQAGDPVSLTAGYQSPVSEQPLVFQGHVFQPLWERVSATDYRLLLHCFIGKWEDEQGTVSVQFSSDLSVADQVRQVVKEFNRKYGTTTNAAPLLIESLDPKLEGSKKTRGSSFFGVPRLFFDYVAVDHGLQYWMSWNGINLQSLAPQSDLPNVVFAPPQGGTSQLTTTDGLTKYTLIGFPQQTQEGIGFRTLLDSELALGTLVKLDYSSLRRLTYSPGQPPPRVDPDGLYVVAGIRHLGDTRGPEWYSEVTAVTRGWQSMYAALQR